MLCSCSPGTAEWVGYRPKRAWYRALFSSCFETPSAAILADRHSRHPSFPCPLPFQALSLSGIGQHWTPAPNEPNAAYQVAVTSPGPSCCKRPISFSFSPFSFHTYFNPPPSPETFVSYTRSWRAFLVEELFKTAGLFASLPARLSGLPLPIHTRFLVILGRHTTSPR